MSPSRAVTRVSKDSYAILGAHRQQARKQKQTAFWYQPPSSSCSYVLQPSDAPGLCSVAAFAPQSLAEFAHLQAREAKSFSHRSLPETKPYLLPVSLFSPACAGIGAHLRLSAMEVDSTVPVVQNMLLLDSEGKRIAVKYFDQQW